MADSDRAAARSGPRALRFRLALLTTTAALAACSGSGSASSSECTDGQTAPCYTGPAGTEGVGICHAGLKTCAGGTFGPCTGEQLPMPETCNGKDDDCNGVVDDGAAPASCPSGVCSMGACLPPCTNGDTRPCYTGPAGTEGRGVCHGGLQTCSGGAFGACVGEVVPTAEVCNGLDDDCNGVVDDGSAAASCPSLVCSMGACQAPTCSDGVKNGDETGVDCGGPTCPKCPVGQGCLVDGDCQSALCYAGTCQSALNGCTPALATDLTSLSSVTISFPVGTSFAYDQPCVKVKAGTVVTFSSSLSSFSAHPLQGGVVVGALAMPASSGPFVPATTSGTSKAFTLSTAGSYPYYCQFHFALGMNGAVLVVP